MKILLFLVLAINFILFIWEYNSGALNSISVKTDIENSEVKQIVLVSELAETSEPVNQAQVAKADTISEKENNEIDKLIKDSSNLVVANNYYTNNSLEKIKPELVKSTADKNQTKSSLLKQQVSKNKQKKALATAEKKSVDNPLLMSKLNLLDTMISKSKKIENKFKGKLTLKSVVSEKTNNKKESVDADTKLKPVAFSKTAKQNRVKSVDVSKKYPAQDNKIKALPPIILNTLCFNIGPFKNKAAAEVWKKQNKIAATSSKLITKKHSKVKSYLVYYPPAKTYKQSKKNVQILKRMGITDFWLFRKGKLKGAISLGMFTKDSRAIRFKAKLANLGLDVKIKKNMQTKTHLFTQIVTNNKKFKDTVVVSKKQALSKCESQK